MKKATTEAAAKTGMMTGAKIIKIGKVKATPQEKVGGHTLIFALGSMPLRKPRYHKPQAVKELEEVADIENQRKHPHTPAKYLAKSKYRDDTANSLTRCIIDFIKLNGGQA